MSRRQKPLVFSDESVAVSDQLSAKAGRYISDELRSKRVAAGKKGRGIDAMKSVRGDPELQARIDMVVEKALSDRQSAISGHDVMFGGQHRAKHGSLKVHRVG